MDYRIVRDTTENFKKPYSKAVRKRYIWKDHRSISSPDFFEERAKKDWFSEGSHHRIENNHIVLDIERMGWFVSVETLEDLHMLFRECDLLSMSIGRYGDDPHIILDLQP